MDRLRTPGLPCSSRCDNYVLVIYFVMNVVIICTLQLNTFNTLFNYRFMYHYILCDSLTRHSR